MDCRSSLGQRLSLDSQKLDEESETLLGRPAAAFQSRKRHASYLVASVIFFLASLCILAFSLFRTSGYTLRECDQRLSSFSTVWDHVEYEDVEMDAALFTENQFKGSPSPKLDRAWESIVEMYPLSIPDGSFSKLRKDPETGVKFPEEHGGGYLAGLEVFHQLHCLRLVRQYTYREYYANLSAPPQAFTDSDHILRKHVDHCIDMIRQVLMCHSDITLVTHSWVDGYDTPFPDFNTWHKCRNFNAISQFAAKAALNIEIKKPTGAKALSEAPGGHAGHGGHHH